MTGQEITAILGVTRSKAGEKFIETVSNAIGVLYEPTRIRNKAQAEADAHVILARSRVKVEEIERRASERFRTQELRRQLNIEKVTRAALDYLPSDVSSNPVDEDWVHQFYGHCQDVGSQELQRLWGKILQVKWQNQEPFRIGVFA